MVRLSNHEAGAATSSFDKLRMRSTGARLISSRPLFLLTVSILEIFMSRSSLWPAVVLAMLANPALAYCSQPSPPYSKPSPPTTPYCVNTWDNTHTCDDWEIDNYNQAIRSYRREIDSYVAELQGYVDAAVEYAKCEINALE